MSMPSDQGPTPLPTPPAKPAGTAATAATAVAAAAMAVLGAIHVAWGAGSSFPARDRATLAETASGRPGQPPGPVACLAVAGLLFSAAALTAGFPRRPSWLRRIGAATVTATFLFRGLLGVSGRTQALFPDADSDRFRDLDRRYYGPLCLAIAALSAPASRRAGSGQQWAATTDPGVGRLSPPPSAGTC